MTGGSRSRFGGGGALLRPLTGVALPEVSLGEVLRALSMVVPVSVGESTRSSSFNSKPSPSEKQSDAHDRNLVGQNKTVTIERKGKRALRRI